MLKKKKIDESSLAPVFFFGGGSGMLTGNKYILSTEYNCVTGTEEKIDTVFVFYGWLREPDLEMQS